ncbi:hypothetical protein HK098_007350 [Nowakowskiella sp. JEL0407]|nr:hypothetical protein HK098_007350 [Nowakowskiella sp. JEL0407]
MRGFAYVEFANPEDAEHAFSKIEYLTVNNRKLTVEWARGERQMPQTMRARERRGGDRDRYRPRDRSRSYDRGYDRRNRSRDRSYDRHKKDRSDDRDRRRSRSRSPHPPSDRRGSYDRRDR